MAHEQAESEASPQGVTGDHERPVFQAGQSVDLVFERSKVGCRGRAPMPDQRRAGDGELGWKHTAHRVPRARCASETVEQK
jgi:hypothetical protein